MTTSAVAIIVPFVTQELFQGGDSLYYGLNAKSGNMIMLDRKNARSPNGLVFGTPGGGKSFSCKREMIGVLLKTHDHVLVCDPEGEYAPLVKLLRGQIIKLSTTQPRLPESAGHQPELFRGRKPAGAQIRFCAVPL